MRAFGVEALVLFALLATTLSRPAAALTANPAAAIAYSPNGRLLGVGGYRAVTLYDVDSGRQTARLSVPAGIVTSVAFSPDGRMLASGGGQPGQSGEIRLWALPAGRQVRLLTGHSDVVYGLAFRPDGLQIASASYDHLAALWSVSTGAMRPLKDHTDAVYAAAYSPDGKRLATASGDRTVKIWDTASAKRVYTLSESTAELYTVAYSPDGRRLAAAGVDKTIRIWTVGPEAGKIAKSAFGHESAVLRLAYSRDGSRLYSSSEDKSVKQWDAGTLAILKTFTPQKDWPQGLAVRADGRQLAVGCYDGSVRLYSTDTGRMARELVHGHPTAAQAEAGPRTSAVSGARAGTHDKPKRATGGPTLFESSLARIAPSGGARGQTLRCTLTGSLISDADRVFFDDPAIAGRVITPSDMNKGILRADVAIGKSARIGLHRLWVRSPHGATGEVVFAVGGGPDVAASGKNTSAETALPLPIPATAVGSLDTMGASHYFKFQASAGDELVFETVASAIRSRLQPVVTVTDTKGAVVAEGGALLGCRFPAAGQYAVRIRDGAGQAGADVTYRLNVGAFPMVTRAGATGLRAGETKSIPVEGFCLGGAHALTVTAPREAAWGQTMSIPVSAVARRGPGSDWHDEALGGVRLAVGADPEVEQALGNEDLAHAQPISVPVTINGRLWAKGAAAPAHFYRFSARRGQRLVFDVLARRMGSPLDSMIEILQPNGSPVEAAVLRAVAQTEITLNDRSSEGAGFRILTWDDFHLGDYLLIGREVGEIYGLPKGPDDDIALRNIDGQRLAYFGTTPEYHTVGQPVYKVEAFPPGTSLAGNGMPLTRLYYRNDDGGPGYGEDSYLQFTAPADGEYVARLSDVRGQQGEDYRYRLMIHPPRPDFRIRTSPANPNIPAGGGALVDVVCDRFEGFDGPIDVSLEGLPAGFSATQSTIQAREHSTTILTSAAANAMNGDLPWPSPIHVVARARVDGRDVMRSLDPSAGIRVVTAIPKADVEVATDLREVVIHPGESASIDADIVRNGNFGARVPLDVRNLPYGVRVEDVGLNGILVTEEDTSRKISIRCDSWVKPQTRPFYVVAGVEGGTSNAALPLLLRIEPGRAPERKSKTIAAKQ